MTPRSWTCVFVLMFAGFQQRPTPAGDCVDQIHLPPFVVR